MDACEALLSQVSCLLVLPKYIPAYSHSLYLPIAGYLADGLGEDADKALPDEGDLGGHWL